MWIARLVTLVTTVLCCSVEREKCERDRQKKYGNIYSVMLKTVTRQLNQIVRIFLKLQSSGEGRMDKEWLNSGEGRDVVIGISRSVTSKWIVPSLKSTTMSVEKSLLLRYMTDTLGALNDCYIRQFLHGSHIDLLREPTERYKI